MKDKADHTNELNTHRQRVTKPKSARQEYEQTKTALQKSEQRYQKLLNKTQQQAQELALLKRVGVIIARELDLNTILHHLVEAVAQTLEYPHVSVYLLKGDTLTRLHQVGQEDAPAQIPLSEGVLGNAARTGRPMLEEGADKPAAQIAVPLNSDEFVGVLNIQSAGKPPLTEDDLQLLTALPEFVQPAIDRAHSYSQARQSEARFRAAAENSLDAFFVLEAVRDESGKITDFRFVDMNRQAETMLSMARETLIGQQICQLFPRDRASSFIEKYAQVIETGEPLEEDLQISPMYATPGWYRHRATPLADSVAINTKDVTERKQAEEALRASREQYRVISELVSDYAYAHRIDPDGNVVLEWVTDAFTRITGYTAADMENPDDWLAVVHPEDKKLFLKRRETLLSGQQDISEHRIFAKNGQLLWLRQYNKPVWDENEGRVVRIYGAAQDITKIKKLEEQLNQAQKMETVGRLAGGIAHDFNNILTVIMGNSTFLLDTLSPDHPLYHDLEQIQTSAERAAGLTKQLLAFSRQQVLRPEILNLNRVVSSTEKMLRRLISEDIELVTNLEPELGRVKADRGQLEQVIVNLAVNASDAMPDGGRLTIETANVYMDDTLAPAYASSTDGPHVMLAVSDTGSGIAEEARQHLFEPFFTTKKQGKGTGLGLATVHGIVKQSNGKIQVHSDSDEGTTFAVYLPQVTQPDVPTKQKLAAANLPQGSGTILVVEDEMIVRQMAARILRKQGYRVLEAGTGPEAQKVIANYSDPIDLLLTDIILPGGINGRQLAAQLTGQRPNLKVLYMSGYKNKAIIELGMLDSAAAFLQKPFSPTGLIMKVSKLLSTRAE